MRPHCPHVQLYDYSCYVRLYSLRFSSTDALPRGRGSRSRDRYVTALLLAFVMHMLCICGEFCTYSGPDAFLTPSQPGSCIHDPTGERHRYRRR